MSALLEQNSLPSKSARPSPFRSGWLIGIVLGVTVGLLALPTVRFTLFGQFQFALSEEGRPFMGIADVHEKEREVIRLDATAGAAPDDYLLQVGRATALAVPNDNIGTSGDDNDHVLFRLAQLAREFPSQPGAYAHLARYMMADRIRVQRPEIIETAAATTRKRPHPTAPPSPGVWRRDVRLIEWALTSGEARDADNAFWPAMLGAAYFAAHRDDEAITALTRAAHKPRWDAYLYEEVLGQWRLYSATYGDHGATQKIGPLSLIAFPHLYEIRHAVEMARWHAERAADAGHDEEALRIRRNLAMLGIIMRETASWSYEALIGTDLILLATTDGTDRRPPGAIQTPVQWERRAPRYLALLIRNQRDTAWVRREVAECCDLRQRVDVARYDASYPGIPPGIPLVPLFGSWMTGICLLQQMLILSVTALLAALWNRYGSHLPGVPLAHRITNVLLFCLMVGSGIMLFSGFATPRIALLFLSGLTLLTLPLNRRFRRTHPAGSKSPDEIADCWKSGTTLRMTVFLVVPLLLCLYERRYFLSSLHPVALLLTSVMGIAPPAAPEDALQTALLGSGLTMALVVAVGFWSLYRRVDPVSAVLLGLRRLTMPLLVCLSLTYIAVLNQTLHLDTATSRALNEVAQNDLQWVLTHSSSP
ncbi:MAG: hypothetical protein JWL77_145 [Chthonomonadaceae bacterium]|nr:hypothetical protein [Chthonomonadaceae bacterium]